MHNQLSAWPSTDEACSLIQTPFVSAIVPSFHRGQEIFASLTRVLPRTRAGRMHRMAFLKRSVRDAAHRIFHILRSERAKLSP